MVIWVLVTNAISLFSALVMRAIWDEAHRWPGSYKAECPLSTLCGRLPVGKDVLELSAGLVGAAMCSACRCGAEGPRAIMP